MTEESRQTEPAEVPTSRTLPATVRHAVDAALDKKALDVVVLDLRASHAFTDFFVLCSGRTTRQVRAIIDEIEERLRTAGLRASHIEGYEYAEWVLVDCFDCVIHAFTHETRCFYDLERLWGNAKRREFKSPY